MRPFPGIVAVSLFAIVAALALGCKKPTPAELSAQLMEAAESGDTDEVARALRRGADPNRADPKGRTPLGVASCLGHGDAVETLLKGGAHPSLPTVYSRNNFNVMRISPLLCAQERNYAQVIGLLQKYGAE
jgi:ankyrin repeat protein